MHAWRERLRAVTSLPFIQRRPAKRPIPGSQHMTDISRRTMLAGGALAGAAAVTGLPPTVHAAAPPSDKQAPGIYRYKVGSHEVTVVTDGSRSFPLTEDYV